MRFTKKQFSVMLQNRPDEFSGEFGDEFQTHRGQRAKFSPKCLEPIDGELCVTPRAISYAPLLITIQPCSLSISRCRGVLANHRRFAFGFCRRRLKIHRVLRALRRNICFLQSAVTVCFQSQQATIHTSSTNKHSLAPRTRAHVPTPMNTMTTSGVNSQKASSPYHTIDVHV